MIGQTISHYKITEKLGEGGMGEVYLAKDASLDRKVALKFLTDYLQQDPIAQKRFLREARSAAALDHPFICKIFETGEAEGQNFIVMEYVKGQTLREKLLEGPVPLKQTLQIGMEVAEALEEAHKAGIAHRDLKPANIMLTSGGHVKVMDFGLAKKIAGEDGAEHEITAALTREGTTLGTLAYMSPEQLRGKIVDTRTDIFSFGIILYELLSGVHPFRKPKQAETSGAILHEEPSPLSRYTEDTSEVLQHTVTKMLAKDPEERYQSVHEVRTNPHRLSGKLSTVDVPSRLGRKKTPVAHPRRLAYWAVGLTAITVLSVALVTLLTPPGIPAAKNPIQLTSDGRSKFIYRVFTDGPSVFYSETDDPVFPRRGVIHHVARTGGDAVPINPWPQEDRLTLVLDIFPDFSRLLAGSSELGQDSPYGDGMPVWILSLPAGTPKRLGDIRANNARWSPDGERIAYSTGNELYLCRKDGTDSHRLLAIENAEKQPLECHAYSWSPDGERICYGAYNWSENTCELWEVGSDGAAPQQLLPNREDFQFAHSGRWTPDGEWLLFSTETQGGTGGSLWALSSHKGWFDRRPKEPIQLTAGIRYYTTFTMSPDGKKIYGLCWDFRSELVRYRQEIEDWVRYSFPATASPGGVSYSPDNEWLAYVSYPDGTLWRSRVDGTQKLQLTELAACRTWGESVSCGVFTLRETGV